MTFLRELHRRNCLTRINGCGFFQGFRESSRRNSGRFPGIWIAAKDCMIGRTVLAAGAVATGVASALIFSATKRWESRTDEVRRQLAAANTVRGMVYSQGEIAGLPAPVQRYFLASTTMPVASTRPGP